tara:strand:- start:192 stop:713 length:522 start_codon:yes stop_codon:yes gene_type:complete
MKRYIPLAMLLMTGAMVAPAANADLTHRLSTSTQLTVEGAFTSGTRIGSTYTVSGNNIKVASADDHFGKLVTPSGHAAATLDAGTYDINTAGSAFSFSESFASGDAVNPIGTGVDVTSGVVADMPAYGTVLTSSGGVASTLAGTITSAGVMTLTAGGAGTTATGQFVSEITVR